MMRRPWFDYKQEYIPHAYLELCIPATADNEVSKGHLISKGLFDVICLESFLTHCGGLTNLVDELSRINLIYLKRKITSKQVQLHTVSST